MLLSDFVKVFASELTITNPLLVSEKTKFRDLEEWSSLFAIDVFSELSCRLGKNIAWTDLQECETIEDIYMVITNDKINSSGDSSDNILNFRWEE